MNYYQPQYPQELRTPEGEPIYTGPYNAEQAPHIECSSCGQPVTVGQRLTVLVEYVLGITQSGRLVYVPLVDFPEPAAVHSDCSAEFAHDQITKEPCGEEADTERFCAGCGAKLDGDEE